MTTHGAILDDALERLRGTSTEVAGGGDPNHGPMAVEALVAMGRADAAIAWVDRYRKRLGPLPGETAPIIAESWRSALGHTDRVADWAAFFRGNLSTASWSEVLTAWLPRLLPGAMSAGMHGLLRTAHIARALGVNVTPIRIAELAMALAYWAAFYRELPGPALLRGTLPLEVAIERVPRVASARLATGLPRDVVFVVGEHPEFLSAVQAAAPPLSIDAGLSALTEVGARAYLVNADRNPLVLLHGVTGPAALRLLLPYLGTDADRATAFAAVYQCSSALIAAYADSRELGSLASERAAVSTASSEIVDRCIETDDPHAIKLVEACLREHRSNPRSVYMAAALDWATRLDDSKGWSSERRGAAGIGFG